MDFTVGDKYEILRPLGQGGMAEVLLAKQRGVEGIDKLVVIKRILPHYASDESFVAMFLDEARVAADLVHPHVASVHEVGEHDGSYYMVLEYLQGRDLRRLQRRLEGAARPIPPGHVVRIGMDVAQGLHYAHSKKGIDGKPLNIVHRDVSPQNVVVTFDGPAKLVDFGIAKASSQQERTETGIIKGKYTYMSPEQARGLLIDGRSDQFSLGVILWELLVGKRLFKRDNDVAVVSAIVDEDITAPADLVDIPAALNDVVMKMLAKAPDDRFATMRDVTLALEDASSSLSVSHTRLGTYLEELFAEELARERRLDNVGAKLLFDRTKSEATHEGTGKEDVDQTVLDAKVRSTVMQAAGNAGIELEDESTAPARSRSPTGPGIRAKGAAMAIGKPPPPILDDDAHFDATEFAPTSILADDDHPATMVLPRRREASPAPAPPTSRMPLVFAAAVALMALVGVVGVLVFAFRGPPTTGDLIVETTPKGARILLDGAITGKTTPDVLHGVSLGQTHRLRVELDDHKPLTVDVRIPKKRGEHRVQLELKRLPPSPIAPIRSDNPELVPIPR